MILPVFYEKAGNLRACFTLVRLITSYYGFKKIEKRVKEVLGFRSNANLSYGSSIDRKRENTGWKYLKP